MANDRFRKDGGQGHGWTETWTACRSTLCCPLNARRKREGARYTDRRWEEREGKGVIEEEGVEERRKEGIYGERIWKLVFSDPNRRSIIAYMCA